MHAPEAQGNPAIAKAMNQELLKVHASDEAWGLTEGLLQHPVSPYSLVSIRSHILMSYRLSEPSRPLLRSSKCSHQNRSVLVSPVRSQLYTAFDLRAWFEQGDITKRTSPRLVTTNSRPDESSCFFNLSLPRSEWDCSPKAVQCGEFPQIEHALFPLLISS
jgi:hypothetical protein